MEKQPKMWFQYIVPYELIETLTGFHASVKERPVSQIEGLRSKKSTNKQTKKVSLVSVLNDNSELSMWKTKWFVPGTERGISNDWRDKKHYASCK